ncbi:MAG: RNA polymerase sigma factor [Gemmataceae bacterium]|nr:RNA polymerase sigma factor [Gemmataceae bacterium]
MAEDDDAALVKRCLRGEESAVRALVERFQDAVFGLCLKFLHHRHDAEDVAQEVFLRMVRGLKGWDSGRPLKPWVLAIAANRCRTHAAKRGSRPEPVDFLPETLPAAAPDDSIEMRRELAVALAALRPEYRAVFVLYHEQGQPYEQIAQAVGRPVGTVKTWLHRARLELLDSLRQRGLVEVENDA